MPIKSDAARRAHGSNREPINPYVPPGPKPNTFEVFDGIDTSTSRPGVDDSKAWWLDGWMPIGPRFLRTMYGIGVALFTAPAGTSIVVFDFANIGATPIAVVILSDGSIYQVNTSTSVSTLMAPAGTIINPSRSTVGFTQWGNQYVLIVSTQTNGYFIWDGTTFYAPGASAPGGGTVPTGISGSSIETYTGRVWITDGASVAFSAPGSFVDFTTGSGGGSFSSSDGFLRVAFTELKQTNGFLYLIADSSINYISGVQTSGSPPTTTFTNQNADPEVGTPWPGTVDVFGRNILFANSFGAHVSYGAAVTKISEALDGVYNTVSDFAGFVPSAAKAIIFGKKCWILLLPIIDPVSGQQVNKLFLWNGKKWWSSPQDVALTFIQHQEIASVLTAWGTDGSSIYPLFNTPSNRFTKTAQSKLWDAPGGIQVVKTVTRLWGMAYYYSIESSEVRISIDNEVGRSDPTTTLTPTVLDWVNAAGNPIVWTNSLGDPMEWFSFGPGVAIMPPTAVGQQGALSGLTIQTESEDMALISISIGDEIAAFRG